MKGRSEVMRLLATVSADMATMFTTLIGEMFWEGIWNFYLFHREGFC